MLAADLPGEPALAAEAENAQEILILDEELASVDLVSYTMPSEGFEDVFGNSLGQYGAPAYSLRVVML